MSLRFPHLALLLAGSALLTACGGGSSSPTPPPPPPPPPEPAVVLLAENLGAEFTPGGITVDAAGTIYVGNRSLTQASKPSTWSQIVKISPAGTVSNFVGTASLGYGAVDGTGAGFGQVVQLAFDARNQSLVAIDQERGVAANFGLIRRITLAGNATSALNPISVTSLPGITYVDLSFTAVAASADGTLYATGVNSRRSSGTASSGYGTTETFGWMAITEQPATQSRSGRLLFAQQDHINYPGTFAVDKTPQQTITVYPGELSATGGLLGRPLLGAAVDSAGNGYIADTGRHVIIKVSPAGLPSIFAGSVNAAGSADGNAAAARLNAPTQMVVDSANNLYVLDSGNFTVRRITPAGVVSTVAGVAGQNTTKAGALPGTLGSPAGLAIDGSGRLYVTVDKGVLRLRLN